MGRKFTIFALFYFVFEGKFKVQAPPGAYIRRGDLTVGFLCYDFGGLTFGGAYFRNFTVSYPAVIDNHRLCTRLRTDGFKKSNVTWFLRGQTSDKICQYKKSSRVCLFWKTKTEELFIFKTIMANYGWR